MKKGGFMADLFSTVQKLKNGMSYYSLPALEKSLGDERVRRLPISIRIILEALLRFCDEKKVMKEDVINLAHWNGKNPLAIDIPFIVSRVLLQDFTGVPLLVDLAAMRDAVAAKNGSPTIINPSIPVNLVIDHSVQVDHFQSKDAFSLNLQTEFTRNRERYEFLKWGQAALKNFNVVSPGVGICHQVNLEYLASVVTEKDGFVYFDTLVGTDSHTTMINGLGVVGWGVGGIEAEAAMLGLAVSMQTPEVIGVHLSGKLQEGVVATDLTLYVTELLRKEKIVGKFIEFFGDGVSALSVADRATIANMAPEYGATMGFFPCDEKTLEYLRMTGREEGHIALVQEYLVAQGLFGVPRKGSIDYTRVIELNFGDVSPCIAGPKRPQDRIDLRQVSSQFTAVLSKPIAQGGYGKDPLKEGGGGLRHGSVVIAAITSCTNTSNPHVMIGSGLVAKKAVLRGLTVNPLIKTSLAPGSSVVTEYLRDSGLQEYLDKLGFQLVAYGCTTCIGNSGPLPEGVEEEVKKKDLIVASVLSGNRNFEARIHPAVKANFLMSPMLVVAFALAGRVDIDFTKEPLGKGNAGEDVYLKDIWPSSEEIEKTVVKSLNPSMFAKQYAHIDQGSEPWGLIEVNKTPQYSWKSTSSYIRKPPYFENFSLSLPHQRSLKNLQPLAVLGDSVTTDHISPAGSFADESTAGEYLLSLGIDRKNFNSYGSRRGNHEVMIRGTFANVALKNKMVEGKEGGYTKLDGKVLPIYDACQIYKERKTPLIIFAGKDYGMGSSRDWAAKGTCLLGVVVVVAQSFERIHRSNLIGMGVLPLEFTDGDTVDSCKITGEETFSIVNMPEKPRGVVILEVVGPGKSRNITLLSRLDTETELYYYKNGGIMPYMLRQVLKNSKA
jgi:aconitate hydratase